MIGTGCDFNHFLVEKAKNDGGFILISDWGIRAIVLFDFFTGVAKLAKFIRAHGVDKARRGQKDDVALAAGHIAYESGLERGLT